MFINRIVRQFSDMKQKGELYPHGILERHDDFVNRLVGKLTVVQA